LGREVSVDHWERRRSRLTQLFEIRKYRLHTKEHPTPDGATGGVSVGEPEGPAGDRSGVSVGEPEGPAGNRSGDSVGEPEGPAGDRSGPCCRCSGRPIRTKTTSKRHARRRT